MSTNWRPRPLILGSILLHAAALGVLALAPQAWPWALGGVLANHALLTLLTFLPDSQLLGRSLRSLPPGLASGHVALTFDDGPDPEVTPRILELLDRHGARATFFCIGENAARHPELVREIAARGHTIGNHTMHHPGWFALLGLGGQRREWQAAQAVLRGLGVASDLARAPLGLRSPLSDLVLHRLGLRHVGWRRRGFDTRCGDPELVLARIISDLRQGDIILLHDGRAARDGTGQAVSIAVLAALLPLLAARGLASIRLEGEAIPP
ncbi:polysaccharide deacetylase family protein [Sediminicoccus sp. KRV36]|uniref:polysaccharide deacetylase family protein n=1 Tax=Sediminicoccus sp. KRV36 TaxID=3133721 RepID=UPI00200EC33B|nr:polysaccharide deacetylase family protein [Sediminicoccus rosea]UPY37596.1 polysaccharide deacetylase family protein [Sediminicoccus rosea]